QPGGGVRITLNRSEEPFRLTVEDNGKGIARENLEKIFQAFALESFNRQEEGFGLNLPRARLIAQAHGWHLWAESDGEGKGTRMIVEARQAS
ncbi:MAG: ATP-binding protein, partial [Thermodesulfobacteriota bacterium]|nr:ATP-binding protein [Thermodesulfobacteriota bacterium]